MALRTFLVLNGAWPGIFVPAFGGQFYRPGDIVQIDSTRYATDLPKWSAAAVAAGAKGWIAPKLAGTDAASIADLVANAAVLGVQASEGTTTDSAYPLSSLLGA
jgi:hypothetical protein